VSKRRTSSVMPVAAPADSTVPTQPPAEAGFAARVASLTALVYETGKSNAKRAEELLASFGFQVVVADDVEEARRHIENGPGVHLVLCGIPGGEAVARAVAARGAERPALVVTSSGETQAGLAFAETFAADSFALRPYKRDALAAALHAVVALRDERRKAAAYEVEIEELREESRKHGTPDPVSGFHHFEFFKKLLVLELKRARRYGYSLAACLVALDEGRLVGVPTATRSELAGAVAKALRKSVRDIDMPVDYADGHMLVFLPHTDIAGAERVGRRMEEAVRGIDGVELQGRALKVTVSVGISALKPGHAVSFAKLVRDAGMALRAAQLKGGARVVVKT
jgi:diguanylate cyclase (GGDEF)-like protein